MSKCFASRETNVVVVVVQAHTARRVVSDTTAGLAESVRPAGGGACCIKVSELASSHLDLEGSTHVNRPGHPSR